MLLWCCCCDAAAVPRQADELQDYMRFTRHWCSQSTPESSVSVFPLYADRLDDKDSVDIHDNPPLPDNVVKEEDNTVRHTHMHQQVLYKIPHKNRWNPSSFLIVYPNISVLEAAFMSWLQWCCLLCLVFGGCDGFTNTLATADHQGGGSGVLELGQLNRVVEHWSGNAQTIPAVSTYCAPNPSPGDCRTPLILLVMENWSQFGPWNWECVHRWMCACLGVCLCVSIQVYYM